MFISTMNLLCAMLKEEEVTVLANAILKSQEIHEDSWDDKNHIYTLTYRESVEKAVDWEFPKEESRTLIVDFITNLLPVYWNESQWWSKSILNINENIRY